MSRSKLLKSIKTKSFIKNSPLYGKTPQVANFVPAGSIKVTVTLNVVIALLYSWIIYYLYKLEKTGCECALGWRRNLIVFVYVFAILLMFIPFVVTDKATLLFLNLAFMFAFFVNAVVMLQYVHKLKEQKCACAQNEATSFTVMKYVAYIQFALLCIMFLYAIYAVLIHVRFLNRSRD